MLISILHCEIVIPNDIKYCITRYEYCLYRNTARADREGGTDLTRLVTYFTGTCDSVVRWWRCGGCVLPVAARRTAARSDGVTSDFCRVDDVFAPDVCSVDDVFAPDVCRVDDVFTLDVCRVDDVSAPIRGRRQTGHALSVPGCDSDDQQCATDDSGGQWSCAR